LLRSKFLGGMLGLTLGDAIGEPAFHSSQELALPSQIADAYRLIYTDDTAMAIGLAKSILQIGHLDAQHLGDTYRANYLREPWRGYAIGDTYRVCLGGRTWHLLPQAARSLFGGQGSFGNGIEAVPPSWLEKLENRPYRQRLARDLVDLTIQME
jgi:poly(ADP-ribose) glycohydrolase ARH3